MQARIHLKIASYLGLPDAAEHVEAGLALAPGRWMIRA